MSGASYSSTGSYDIELTYTLYVLFFYLGHFLVSSLIFPDL